MYFFFIVVDIFSENQQTECEFIEYIKCYVRRKKNNNNNNEEQLNCQWTNDENIIVKSFDTERENEKEKKN